MSVKQEWGRNHSNYAMQNNAPAGRLSAESNAVRLPNPAPAVPDTALTCHSREPETLHARTIGARRNIPHAA